MTLNSPIRTFVISMPASEQRRSACMQAARNAGLEPEWFEAANGRQLMAEYEQGQHPSEICLQDQTVLELGLGRRVTIAQKLSAGELGCAWSHLSIYQKMRDEGIEHALILEDDAILKPAFKEALPLIMQESPRWDLVQIAHDCGIRDFYWRRDQVIEPGRHWSLRYKGMGWLNPIFNRRRGAWLTGAYLINLRGAERLIDIGFPVRIPADY